MYISGRSLCHVARWGSWALEWALDNGRRDGRLNSFCSDSEVDFDMPGMERLDPMQQSMQSGCFRRVSMAFELKFSSDFH